VDFIISHLEGPAKEELRYCTASDKKTPGAVLKILKDVFGERSTLSELLSGSVSSINSSTERSSFCPENFCNFLSLGAKMTFGPTGESLQDYSHDLMNKLDKIHKKDPKAIKDRDVAIRNQFAENVRGPWLRRDLKKRFCCFSLFNVCTSVLMLSNSDVKSVNTFDRSEFSPDLACEA
jgi:hypothetical protein